MGNVGPALAKVSILLVGAVLAYEGARATMSGRIGQPRHPTTVPCASCLWEEAYGVSRGLAGSLPRIVRPDDWESSLASLSRGTDLGFSAQAPMFALPVAGALTADEMPGRLNSREGANGWVIIQPNGAFGGGAVASAPMGSSATDPDPDEKKPRIVAFIPQPDSHLELVFTPNPKYSGMGATAAVPSGLTPASGATAGLAPVPLPSGALLFGSGLLGCLAVAHRQRRGRKAKEAWLT